MCERPVRIAILDDGVYPAACPVAGSLLLITIPGAIQNFNEQFTRGA